MRELKIYEPGECWTAGVRFPAEAGNFCLRHRIQTSSVAHPASSPVGTGGYFTGGKAVGA